MAPRRGLFAWLLALGVAGISALELASLVETLPLARAIVEGLNLTLVALLFLRLALEGFRQADRLFGFLKQQAFAAVILAAALVACAIAPRAGVFFLVALLVHDAWEATFASGLGRKALRFANKRPSRILALTFLGAIAAGTLLLLSPAATPDRGGLSLLDALFTMTSAVCVTGLVVRDTGTQLTLFGQLVILAGIHVGGIGMMTLGASFAALTGGVVPRGMPTQVGESYGALTTDRLRHILLVVTLVTFAIELAGAFWLFSLWLLGPLSLPPAYDHLLGAMYWSAFHAVSAFCNAGFVLQADSLTRWAGQTAVSVPFAVLITLGGLGVVVLLDLSRREVWQRRHVVAIWRKLALQTRVVLLMTIGLNLVGGASFLFFEYGGALGGLSVAGKIDAAFFHAISFRTAGFYSTSMSGMSGATLVIALVWMFIGAGPGSTAGGVKLTTAAVAFAALRAMLRGREDAELFGRTLPRSVVYRSLSIVLIAVGFIAIVAFLLAASQPVAFAPLLFDCFSAFGTVGLTLGVTGQLDPGGKALIIVLMYVGRVGPLTLALALGERHVPHAYRYPSTRMAVG